MSIGVAFPSTDYFTDIIYHLGVKSISRFNFVFFFFFTLAIMSGQSVKWSGDWARSLLRSVTGS